jgi:hypothetical protein
MLSLLRPFLAREATVFTEDLSDQSQSSLRGLRDLRAMLSLLRPFLALEATVFTEDLSDQSQSPSVASVTSVRCFLCCARFSHWKPRCSLKTFRTNPNPPP